MKRLCNTCVLTETCLKRTLGIFLLYIRTGRIAELTPAVKDNFCVAEECENWLPIQLPKAVNKEEIYDKKGCLC